jgi:nucleobase:cation symporter-1, NCS1 family
VGAFLWVFVPSLTAIVGFWATLSLNIPDFTRYGKSQREQMLGQTLGLPTTMVAFSAMGVMVTSASRALLVGVPPEELWDPVKVLSYLTASTAPPGLTAPLLESGLARTVVALLALFGVAIATISVNIAANVVSPANDFANLAPRYISFRTGGLITGLLGIAMMPWKLMSTAGDYVFTWLIGYSALLGPIAGVMVVDYWWVRRGVLDVPDLYRPTGRYAGVNPIVILALLVGVAPNVPGFLHAVGLVGGVGVFDTIYIGAWFVGFGLAGTVYAAGSRRGPPL